MDRKLIDALHVHLDDEVTGAARLGGGDFAESFRVDFASGRRLFAKTHRNPPPYFFTTEASGLGWLAEPADGVIDSVAVPAVVLVSDGLDEHETPAMLVLDWIDESRGWSRPDAEAAFGAALARLHRRGAPSFGRDDRRTTGSLALPNDPRSTWVEFYGECRLGPLRQIATDRASLPATTLALIDDVIDRLAEVGGPVEPPARLHGDLWAGNRLVDSGDRSWLIDPAAHGGHREFDLAMMRLFGGFGDAAFSAYDAEFPLASGWQQRIALHQLAPLIVHAIKFGGGYVRASTDALREVLS